jgi:hypothetical protein
LRISLRGKQAVARKPLKTWSERQDLNLRPPRPERGAPSSQTDQTSIWRSRASLCGLVAPGCNVILILGRRGHGAEPEWRGRAAFRN